MTISWMSERSSKDSEKSSPEYERPFGASDYRSPEERSFSRSRRSKSGVSLRVLVVVVSLVILAAFSFAAVALTISVTERDARINENTKATEMNTRRQERNCERITVLVALVDKLTPSVELAAELAAIDRRYPDVTPCKPTKEK